MTSTTTSIQVKEGLVSTDPIDFANAIQLIRREKLRGLWIRHDYFDKKPDPPMVDLALLKEVTFIDDFGMSPDLALKRISGFDTIYQLSKLKKLALHNYKKLDLSKFPKLETLFLTDAPGLTNIETLVDLKYARITKFRADDLSFLAGMRQLSELWIIQAASKRLKGLELSPVLTQLDISHCSKLEGIDALPASLEKLKIKKCPKLRDLSFLASHPSLNFLYIDVMETLSFMHGLRHVSYVGFENVVDGDLEPLVKSKSLLDVGFYPTKRKHYSHSEAELKKMLSTRKT